MQIGTFGLFPADVRFLKNDETRGIFPVGSGNDQVHRRSLDLKDFAMSRLSYPL